MRDFFEDPLIQLALHKRGGGGGGPSIELDTLSVTQNGTYTPESGHAYDEVNVNVPAVASVEPNDVTYIDYDGTIVAAYTAAEFAALTAHPDAPTHDGLTFQEWNWTLSDAKAYAAKYGMHVIGATYIPTDGATKVHFKVDDELRKVAINICSTGANGTVDVDWGDGSAVDTLSGSDIYPSHTYAQAGEYVCSIWVRSGDMYIDSFRDEDYSPTDPTVSLVTAVMFGTGMTPFSSALSGAYNLRIFTLPAGYNTVIPVLASSQLKALVLPSAYTQRIPGFAFENCEQFEWISFSKSIRQIEQMAFYQSGIRRLALPDGVTSITNAMITQCFDLEELVIPSGVRTLGMSLYQYTPHIKRFHFDASGSSLTEVSCLAESNTRCESVVIPEGVTTIGSGPFKQAKAMRYVDLPSTVTVIGDYFLNNAEWIREVHVRATEPPTLGAYGLSTSNNEYFTVYVPAASVAAYKAATNWASFADRIQAEPA